MEKNELCVQNPEQLSELKSSFFPFNRKEISCVIDDPNIPSDLRKNWAKILNERLEDCGCHVAGFGFTVAAALYAVWIVLGPIRLAELNLSHLWYGLITVVAGLLIGKFIGYTIARIKLSNTIRQIQEDWSSQTDLQLSDLAEA